MLTYQFRYSACPSNIIRDRLSPKSIEIFFHPHSLWGDNLHKPIQKQSF